LFSWYEYAFCRNARLPIIEEPRLYCGLGRALDICVIENDERVGAAEFKNTFLQSSTSCLRNQGTDPLTASESNCGNSVVPDCLRSTLSWQNYCVHDFASECFSERILY